MIDYVTKCLKLYATFDGRARRSEYWYFALFNFILSFITGFIDQITGLGIFGIVVSLGLLVPSIAVACRRMHDVGKSGWFMLIPFYNLYLAVSEGDSGTNDYGPDPKGGSDFTDSGNYKESEVLDDQLL